MIRAWGSNGVRGAREPGGLHRERHLRVFHRQGRGLGQHRAWAGARVTSIRVLRRRKRRLVRCCFQRPKCRTHNLGFEGDLEVCHAPTARPRQKKSREVQVRERATRFKALPTGAFRSSERSE